MTWSFEEGAHPTAYYSDQLRKAYRAFCLFYSGRTTVSRDELEPMWPFVESVAVARIYGVPRGLYDFVDRQINKTGRAHLLELSLRGFLVPGIEAYLETVGSPNSAVRSQDVLLCHVRLQATLDWLDDNQWQVDQPTPTLQILVEQFRSVVLRHRALAEARVAADDSLRATWVRILSAASAQFLNEGYRLWSEE